MTVALYLTIWMSLVLFAVGETGRLARGPSAARWAWAAYVIGLLLCVVHIAIALAHVHGWSHAAAARATATRTFEVFGLDWGGGVYVNYLFVLAWAVDAIWWRRDAARGTHAGVLRWMLRAFYAIVLINAAVVFASGLRWILGVVLIAWLVALWARPSRG